jgi:hypothetical protein
MKRGSSTATADKNRPIPYCFPDNGNPKQAGKSTHTHKNIRPEPLFITNAATSVFVYAPQGSLPKVDRQAEADGRARIRECAFLS